MGNGSMASNTEEVSTIYLMEVQNKEYGRKEKEFNG